MEALAGDILEQTATNNWQLNMQMFCEQGYNRAGTMAESKKAYVAASIMNKYLKSLYTYYASPLHCGNNQHH